MVTRSREQATSAGNGRVARPAGIVAFLVALVVAGVVRPSSVRAQDGHILLPADSVEFLMTHAPLQLPDSLRDTRFRGDRTQRVPLWFGEGDGFVVKWARADRGGETFNNSPRYELAAYRLQKLFLDEPEYVVPPTAARVVPLSWYRERERRVRSTFSDTESVLVLLQYWLYSVTPEGVFDPDRFESDTAYARNWGNANLLTYLIRHSDSNDGNLLISAFGPNPRVFAVDNGVSFESSISDRGTRWRSLQVDRFPSHTVERLASLTLDDLREELGVLLEYRVEGRELVPVPPGPNLDPERGIRREGDVVQLGLTEFEILGVWSRIESFLQEIDEGRYRTFVAGAPPS